MKYRKLQNKPKSKPKSKSKAKPKTIAQTQTSIVGFMDKLD